MYRERIGGKESKYMRGHKGQRMYGYGTGIGRNPIGNPWETRSIRQEETLGRHGKCKSELTGQGVTNGETRGEGYPR